MSKGLVYQKKLQESDQSILAQEVEVWKTCTTAAFAISLFLRQYFDPKILNMTFDYGVDRNT